MSKGEEKNSGRVGISNFEENRLRYVVVVDDFFF